MPARRLIFTLLLISSPAFAGEIEYEIEVTDSGFKPAALAIPAHTKFELEVENKSSKNIEFHIHALDLEMGIPAGAEREAILGPLEPGRYAFEDKIHSTLQGVITVK